MNKLLPVLFFLGAYVTGFAQALPASVHVYDDTTICSGQPVMLYAQSDVLQTTTYNVSSIAYTPYSYSTGTTVTMSDDAISAVIPIGFTFCFFGTSYTNFYIGSNGWISFSTQPTTFTAASIPNTGATIPKDCIMGPWQDWHPGIAGGPYIRYQLYGTSPNRVLVVSWNNCPMFSCTTTLGTFQIAIYEGSNIIENYLANKPNCLTWAGGNAVQGIHNAAGTVAYTVAGRNCTQWTATNEGWRYTPSGAPNTYNWYAVGSPTLLGTNDSLLVTPMTTTDYYVRYTPICGTQSPKDTVRITVNPSPLADAGNDTLVCGAGSTTLTATPLTAGTHGVWSSATPTVSFTNDTLASTNATGFSPGLNTIYWTVSSICDTVTDTLIIDIYPPPIANAGNDTAYSCPGASSITLRATAPLPGAHGKWSTITAGVSFSDDTIFNTNVNSLASGLNTLVWMVYTNCDTVYDTLKIDRFVLMNITVDSLNNTHCPTDTSGFVWQTVTGGAPPLIYSWSNGDNTEDLTGVGAGIYTFTVTDNFGCIKTSADTIVIDDTIVYTVLDTIDAACFGGNTGEIHVSATGGALPLSFTLNGGAPQPTGNFTGLGAGIYFVNVQDIHGCSDGGIYVLTAPSDITTAYTVFGLHCPGDSNAQIVLSASGGVAPYTYSIGGAFQSSPIFTGLPAGTYNAVVMDDSACTDFVTINISSPVPLTIAIDAIQNASCFGGSDGSIDIGVSGGAVPYMYNWSTGGVTDVVSGLAMGSYYVTVTDDSGCVISDTFSITEPTQLVLNSTVTDASCYGGADGACTAIPAGGTSPYTYFWNTVPLQTTQTATSLAAGIYTVTVSDDNGCTATISDTVGEAPQLLFSSVSFTNPSCFNGGNGTITMNGTGGTGAYQYSINAGGTYQVSTLFTGLVSGVYNLRIKDANNCTHDTSITLTDPPRILPFIISTTGVSCNGGSNGNVTIGQTAGNPPYTYSVNGTTYFSSNAFTTLQAGNHTAYVRDNTGCVDSVNFSITQPPLLTINLVPTNPLCFGDSSGSITVNAGGGSPAYHISVNGSPYVPVSTVTNLWANFYSITVMDDSGCTATASATLINPPLFIINAVSTPENCVGANDGVITVIPNGGTAPYNSFGISPTGTGHIMQTSPVFNNVAAGNYFMIGYDNNGCAAQTNVTVLPAVPDSFEIIVDSTTCYGTQFSDGGIEVNATQNPPYYYALNDSVYSMNNHFANLAAGSYVLYTLNGNGCKTALPVIVYQPPPIWVDIIPDSSFIPLGGGAPLTVIYSNVTNPEWVWMQTNGLDCPDCPHPTISTYQTQLYELRLYKPGTDYCYGEAFTWVIVDTNENMYVPNAFTPNGDGVNDVFLPIGNDVADYYLQVYNRWGEKLFETSNQMYGWDGYYKDVLMKPGVYVYYLEYHALNKKWIKKQGSVTLIR